SVYTTVYNPVRVVQPLGQVVGIEDCHLGRFRQPFRSHHPDITVGDGEYASTSVGGCRDGVGLRFEDHRMSGQERYQVFGHADGAHSRSATTVGDGKCLMQVQVANIGTDGAGVGHSYLGVHVCAIHINL